MAWARAFRITLAAALPAGSMLVFGTGAEAARTARTAEAHAAKAHAARSDCDASTTADRTADTTAGRVGVRRESPTRVEPHAPARRQMARMEADFAQRRRPGSRRPRRITVPLWVHVITTDTLKPPDTAVRHQVETLNRAYSGGYGGVNTGIHFALKGITHTANTDWFRDPIAYEQSMKRALRRGGPETLNLYLAQLGELVLGYSTYPYWYKNDPMMDGVVIDWRSLPGGPLRNFDRGFTGVHEIGHWLGLVHTFENGCDVPGDSVDDTPPEAAPTEGCPATRKDTCPAPGDDPVHNFMDYAYDRCMNQFTAGQGARMRQMWDAYRKRTALT